MHYNEPLPIALDHEATFRLDMAEFYLSTAADSHVVLCIDENSSSLFPYHPRFDRFIDAPVNVKATLQVGEAGIKFISAIYINLNLTFKELFAGLSFERDPQSDGAYPNDPVAKAYVNVLLRDGTYHVHIQTPKATIHDAEYKNDRR
nr:MAG TPA: hypothetical protein [Caudoviricetes sp.]